jgi:hypothetical protein
MEPQQRRRPGEAVFMGLMVAVSIFLWWNAYKISGFSSKSSPGAFPLAATTMMVIASLVAFFHTLQVPIGDRGLAAFRAQVAPNIVLAFGAMILAYGLALENIGFIITSFAFLFAGMLLLYRKGAGPALFWSVVSIVLVYVVFRLVFKVVLPEGLVPERRILAELGAFFARLLGGQ